MPLVTVSDWNLKHDHIAKLQQVLPVEVARALHIEWIKEAHLTADDIEVIFDHRGVDDIHGDLDYSVRVEAMYFDQRVVKREESVAQIAEALESVLLGLKGSVWLVLPIAAYVEFGKK